MKIAILTEGGKNIGFGHITRCVALLEGLKKAAGRRVAGMFVINNDRRAVRFLESQGVRLTAFDWIEKRKKTAGILKGADLVIIDSYFAPPSFYSFLSHKTKDTHPFVVAIDDYKRIEYDADLVINPSIYGDALSYAPGREHRAGRRPEYLLGRSYIIVRREFWNVPRKKINKKIRNVLVSFGGKDYDPFTEAVFTFLETEFPHLAYDVVAPSRPAGLSRSRFRFYSNVSAAKMRSLMLKADLCISAGGQTLHELARCGVPAASICFADNQVKNLKGWEKIGFAKYVGWYDDRNVFARLGRAVCALSPYKERLLRSRIGRRIAAKGVERISRVLLTKTALKQKETAHES
ncbi:MAG: hypothetical protein JW844_01110 [Candidatus Omnitrophica bacterium]|nr:hypothetical protein [Candidatus Omnitrophota bacterium]